MALSNLQLRPTPIGWVNGPGSHQALPDLHRYIIHVYQSTNIITKRGRLPTVPRCYVEGYAPIATRSTHRQSNAVCIAVLDLPPMYLCGTYIFGPVHPPCRTVKAWDPCLAQDPGFRRHFAFMYHSLYLITTSYENIHICPWKAASVAIYMYLRY